MGDERAENRPTKTEQDKVAGGNTYTWDGFLRTAGSYSCEYFVCKYCGKTGERKGRHVCASGCGGDLLPNNCMMCKYHTALKCSNPLNQR